MFFLFHCSGVQKKLTVCVIDCAIMDIHTLLRFLVQAASVEVVVGIGAVTSAALTGLEGSMAKL